MKILYHHRTLGDGAEGIHIASVVDALRAAGHEVKVVSLIGEGTNVDTPRTRFLSPIKRAVPRAVFELMEYGYGEVGFRALLNVIERWRPDVLYERYSLFNRAGVRAARRTGIPLVLEVNAPLSYERHRYERLVLKRAARRIEASICAQADAVVAVSTPLREHLVQLGVTPGRIVVMPNAADPSRFTPDAAARPEILFRHHIDSHAVIVGFTGAPRPWHGVDLLLKAVAQARRAGTPLHAVIVGDGPSVPDLRNLAKALGLTAAVTFTGRVEHHLIPRYVAAFDIGVSPRATFYASPMKVPEYMAAGVATVAPRMANLVDLVADGIDGCLFEPERVDDLARVLRRLADDPAYRRQIGAAARAAILGGRTWDDTAAAVVDLAEGLGRSAARRRPATADTARARFATSLRMGALTAPTQEAAAQLSSWMDWLHGFLPHF